MSIERLRGLMAREGVDAVLVASPENTLYLSGAFIMTHDLIPARLGLVLVPRDGDPVLIISRVEEAFARRFTRVATIQTYTYIEFDDPGAPDAPIPVAAGLLRSLGLAGGTLAVEEAFLPVESFQILTSHLPEARIVDGGKLLSRVRWQKLPEEIALLRRAGRAARAAVLEAFAAGSAGCTEKQVADCIARNLLAAGADMVTYVFLGCGPHSTMVHWLPTATPIQDGQVVRVDVAARFSGYYGDLARTAVAGAPSQEQARIYRAVVQTHRRVIEAVRPGVPVRDLYHLASQSFRAEGLSFQPLHIGHGIGAQLHERPMIAPWALDALEEDMVLNIEIAYRDGTAAGYHVEDLVHVVRDGAQVLTNPLPGDEIPVLGCGFG